MTITSKPELADFEFVDDVLDGFDLTVSERTQIEERTSMLLETDAGLKALRVASGIRQVDVAEAMGVTKSSVAQLESRSLADVKCSTLTRYLKALGYELSFTVSRANA